MAPQAPADAVAPAGGDPEPQTIDAAPPGDATEVSSPGEALSSTDDALSGWARGGRARGRRPGKRLVLPQDKPAALTPPQRLLLLDTRQRSQLPAGDFAALVGISKHTLYAWKKRFDQQGELNDALPFFEQALRLRPGYPQAHYELGNLHGARGRREKLAGGSEVAPPGRQDFQSVPPGRTDLPSIFWDRL
jgi:hypothetical protein